MADLSALQKRLGVSFQDISRLEQALVHSSYINENLEMAPASNERLEFLGDAVLSLVVAEKLYQDYSNFSEGELTQLRAALVRQETLARIAGDIGLGSSLYLGKGEEAGGGRQKPANLAAALEAVIAAVFLDQGLAKVRDCILRLMDAELKKVTNREMATDCKSELQHFAQSRKQETPVYQVIEATGPEHDRIFSVEVSLGRVVLGRGSGKSKKAAETEAARAALESISKGFTA